MPAKILVVDDEPDLKLLIQQKFRRQIRDGRFDFLFAHNGVEALAQLDANPNVDLILSDINMPEMDGLTLLTKLPQSPNQLKAVMVSAYGDLQNIRTAMNRGAFDFVTKPIDFEDLEVTIQKTVEELLKLRDGLKARQELLAIRRELDVARQIQQSILPRDFGPKGPAGGCSIVGRDARGQRSRRRLLRLLHDRRGSARRRRSATWRARACRRRSTCRSAARCCARPRCRGSTPASACGSPTGRSARRATRACS